MRLIDRLLPYPLTTGHPGLYELLDIAARDVQPSAYLEIGVLEGASLLTVLNAAPSLRRLVLCDTWGGVDGGTNLGSHAHIDALLAHLGYRGGAFFLDGDSAVTVPRIPLTAPFDLITVDACHTADAAHADLTNAWRLLRPGGCLVMDDIERDHIWGVWTAFLTLTHAQRIYEIDDGANRCALVRRPEGT